MSLRVSRGRPPSPTRCTSCGSLATRFVQLAWTDASGERTGNFCVSCTAEAMRRRGVAVIGEVE